MRRQAKYRYASGGLLPDISSGRSCGAKSMAVKTDEAYDGRGQRGRRRWMAGCVREFRDVVDGVVIRSWLSQCLQEDGGLVAVLSVSMWRNSGVALCLSS